MNNITWNDYVGLSDEEKLNRLKGYWNITDNILIGKMGYKNIEKGFFTLKPLNLNLEQIQYPYDYDKSALDRVFGFIQGNKGIEDLNEGDGTLFCFEFELNSGFKEEREKPIKVKAGSVKILQDYWHFIRDLGFEKDDSIFNKNVITNKFEDKLYFVKDLDNLYSNYEKKLNENIDCLKVKLNELQNEGLVKEEEINYKKEEINNLQKKILRLKELGYPVDFISTKEYVECESIDIDISNHITYIRDFLKNKERLFYSHDIITRFYNGIKVNQIILLSGPPGTGKTSLVTGFAKAINARCKVIAVKPNWMDNEDLLGFFNPIENVYVPTPFLDVLAQARIDELQSKDNIYIVCLDEMNLAHIEYYFSEFITKLELNEPSIELYSKNTYDKLNKEILDIIKRMDVEIVGEVNEGNKRKWCEDNDIDYSEYQKDMARLENLKRYPAIFKIPKNIRFVGTLNMDETTKELSPKVLDRSFVIEITDQEEEKIEFDPHLKPIFLSTDDINLDIKDEGQFQQIKEKIKEYNVDYFHDLGVKVSNRGFNKIKEYTAASEKAGLNQIDEIIDAIFACKVLPRINFYKDSEQNGRYLVFKDFLNHISTNQEKYPITYNKLNRMKQISEESNVFTFWG